MVISPVSARRVTVAHLLLLSLLLLALVLPRWQSENFTDTDAAVHAMTGVFFLDLAHDRPAPRDFMRYAQEYYAHYPALGLVIYPPLVQLALVPFYAVFGIAPNVARGMILLFALLHIVIFYFLVRRFTTPITALFAGLLVVSNPDMIRWSSEVMLEVPSLVFMTGALYAWLLYREDGHPRYCYYAWILATAAVYSKQTAGFVIVPMVLDSLFRRGIRSTLQDRHLAMSVLVSAVLIAPLAWATLRFGSYGTAQLDPATFGRSPATFGYWTEWMGKLNEVVSWPILALAAISTPAWWRSPRRGFGIFWILVFTAWYAMFSSLPVKTLRFATFIVPAWCVLASLSQTASPRRMGGIFLKRLAWIVPVFLLWEAFLIPAPVLSGIGAVAEFTVARANGRPVLFDDHESANFIYEVRRRTSRSERALVLRGSKMITATSGEWRSYPQITTPGQFIAFLNRTGVEWILAEDDPGTRLHLAHTQWLREALAGDSFVMDQRFPIQSTIPEYTATSIQAYRYRAAPPAPDSGVLEIFVPSANLTVRVPLKRNEARSR